jgi:predicted N-acetyltransferase YhbS
LIDATFGRGAEDYREMVPLGAVVLAGTPLVQGRGLGRAILRSGCDLLSKAGGARVLDAAR